MPAQLHSSGGPSGKPLHFSEPQHFLNHYYDYLGPPRDNAQRLLLALHFKGHQGIYGVLETEPRLAACKAGALPTVLSLWPHLLGMIAY